MRRTVTINYFPKMLLGNIQIIQKLFKIFCRELAVKTPHQSDSFLACNMPIANFMRGIRSSTADSEFNESQIKMKTVSFVIQTGVFGVRPLGTPVWISAKTSMLN